MAWLSESDYRQGEARAIGLTLNVAFLKDIKSDFDFRRLLNEAYRQLDGKQNEDWIHPMAAAEVLGSLRDELKTYFALEEFYGYFSDAAVVNPRVDQAADQLKSEHETLFLQLDSIVETALQIAYREVPANSSVATVFSMFEEFCMELADHEQSEMDLMMRLCNEDIGVGD